MRNLSVILSSNMSDKNIEVLYSIDPSLPQSLIGDSLRLQQVLLNLAGNAIKFTEHGEVLIDVSVLSFNDEGVDIEFSVKDSGRGISRDKLSKVFEEFN
jgi:two-component system sensor histidine kinase/response regulator